MLDGNAAVVAIQDSAENGSKTPEQPDQDTIKMFVGQVPRTMDENELRGMFEEFGPVYQINVLRDKITGQSKGTTKKQPVGTGFMSKYISFLGARLIKNSLHKEGDTLLSCYAPSDLLIHVIAQRFLPLSPLNKTRYKQE